MVTFVTVQFFFWCSHLFHSRLEGFGASCSALASFQAFIKPLLIHAMCQSHLFLLLKRSNHRISTFLFLVLLSSAVDAAAFFSLSFGCIKVSGWEMVHQGHNERFTRRSYPLAPHFLISISLSLSCSSES